jgi:hypothetical protein
MSLTSFMLGFDRQSGLFPRRPRSKSIEHKVRIRGIFMPWDVAVAVWPAPGCLRNFGWNLFPYADAIGLLKRSNGFLLRGLQVRILLGSPMISRGCAFCSR